MTHQLHDQIRNTGSQKIFLTTFIVSDINPDEIFGLIVPRSRLSCRLFRESPQRSEKSLTESFLVNDLDHCIETRRRSGLDLEMLQHKIWNRVLVWRSSESRFRKCQDDK